MPVRTIEDVIHQLEKIVSENAERGDCLGIFAQLYLGVTRMVAQGIQNGQFDDGPRMERLDVVFAKRYLDAYAAYTTGQPLTRSWQTAFDAAKSFNLLTLQHLLMGMNAHINLDLGIAAAETVPPAEIESLENDFFIINQLLTDNIDHVQQRLNQVSPLSFLLDWAGKKSDEQFAAFSMVQARTHAWRVAKRLASCPARKRQQQIDELDRYVAVLNKLITEPGMMSSGLFRLVKWFEVKDVRRVIEVLG